MSTHAPTGETTPGGLPRSDAGELVGSVPTWYHTLELGPGLVTPGWFDLRPILDRMPWPDVAGKRCLDVGPWDGHLSFELERRGAAEVIAVDIGDVKDWDWPHRLEVSGPAALAAEGETSTGAGFEVARRCLGSSVERRELSVYDLDRAEIGGFDVVVCGSLLLHLKNPIGALEAIRDVCDGYFLSAEQIDPMLTLTHRRRASAVQLGGERCQWWVPNALGHLKMIGAAGFAIEEVSGPYSVPLGPGHARAESRGLRAARGRIVQRLATNGTGVPHSAAMARPSRDRKS